MRAKQKKKYTNSPLERDHRVSVRARVCVYVSAISSEKFRAPIYTTRSNSRSTNSPARFAHANLTMYTCRYADRSRALDYDGEGGCRLRLLVAVNDEGGIERERKPRR